MPPKGSPSIRETFAISRLTLPVSDTSGTPGILTGKCMTFCTGIDAGIDGGDGGERRFLQVGCSTGIGVDLAVDTGLDVPYKRRLAQSDWHRSPTIQNICFKKIFRDSMILYIIIILCYILL